jgi:hypothetical protein
LEPALIKEGPSLPKADRERTHPEAITALLLSFQKIMTTHKTCYFIIPAKAGIQLNQQARRCGTKLNCILNNSARETQIKSSVRGDPSAGSGLKALSNHEWRTINIQYVIWSTLRQAQGERT